MCLKNIYPSLSTLSRTLFCLHLYSITPLSISIYLSICLSLLPIFPSLAVPSKDQVGDQIAGKDYIYFHIFHCNRVHLVFLWVGQTLCHPLSLAMGHRQVSLPFIGDVCVGVMQPLYVLEGLGLPQVTSKWPLFKIVYSFCVTCIGIFMLYDSVFFSGPEDLTIKHLHIV